MPIRLKGGYVKGINSLSKPRTMQKVRDIAHETLHNLLFYHQKQGHIMHIRRGLYCIIPYGINLSDCPIDSLELISQFQRELGEKKEHDWS